MSTPANPRNSLDDLDRSDAGSYATKHRVLPLRTVVTVAALLAASASAQLVRTYENTTAGAVPYQSSNANCGTAGLVRTFTVPETFTYNSVALGLTVSHLDRGDLRVLLTPPGGAQTLLFAQTTGDTNDNYDILLSTNTEAALNDGDLDPTAAPYFNRLVTNSALGSAPFLTGNANGTWTLRLCDRDNNSVNGTFERAYLMLGQAAAATASCTGTVSYDWGQLGGTGVNPTPLAGNPVTVGGITISQTATVDYAGTASESFTMRNTTNGNHSGYYSLIMNATLVGGTQDNEAVGLTSVIGFSTPVRDLSFSLLDVDITTDAWEDQIQVIGVDTAGNRVPYTLTPAAGATVQRAGDVAEGDSAAAVTDTTGNLAVVFSGAVSSLTLNYSQGSNPTTENNQMVIGISDFVQCGYDFGDAPASYGTTLAADGARHTLGNRLIYLGANPPDGEADGQPTTAGAPALVDDGAMVGSIIDEDGLTANPGTCPDNGTYSLSVSTTNLSGSPGYLVGYLDWSRNGAFEAGTSEQSATVTVPTGTSGATQNLTWSSVPANCGGSTVTYLRLRFTTDQARAESPTDAGGAFAPDGEVEDFRISASTLPVTLAWVEPLRERGGLAVRFMTATESLNAGFRIWGRGATKRWQRLAEVPSAVGDSFAPQSYEAFVKDSGVLEILVEDVGADGTNRLHGPFPVGTVSGRKPEVAAIDWASVKREAGLVSALDRMMAVESGHAEDLVDRRISTALGNGLLLVREAGIHRVTYEQLLAGGIDLGGVASEDIALLHGGVAGVKPLPLAATPRFVSSKGSFGPGSYIEFLAEPRLTLASPVDAYEIKVSRASARPVADLPVGAAELAVTAARIELAPDRQYSPSSPNGDPWYDDKILAWGAPASLRRSFDLPDLASGSVSLTFEIWGYGDRPGTSPDHHAVLRLNGTEIASERFDGIRPVTRKVDVTGLVAATGNLLELVVPGDTGFDFDYMAFEGFSVNFVRQTRAIDGRFRGATAKSTAFAIDGFDSEPVALWQTKGSSWLRGEQVPFGGRVVAAGGATEVIAATASRILTPAIVAGIPAAQKSSSAQYLIVTHPALADSLGDLVALEKQRGFTVEVVTTDKIFAAYSGHLSSAEAVRQFLGASISRRSLRYVLLVGADTSDPYDHLGAGSVSYVPTAYLPYARYVTYSPSDESLVDVNGDGVGEVPIGRLPVRTPAEIAAVVDKLRSWESNLATARSATLVAGKSDSERALSDINELYAASLPSWSASQVRVDDLGTSAARQAVLGAMNAGSPLVSFVGHSSYGRWDFSTLFEWQDVAALGNVGRPNLVAQWGCWTSYYVEPGIESLSSRLLLTPGVGAAGTIGATTLTTDASHQLLGSLFYQQLEHGATTVGEAFRNAKRVLQARGGGEDAILGMTLLGDPAMSLSRSK